MIQLSFACFLSPYKVTKFFYMMVLNWITHNLWRFLVSIFSLSFGVHVKSWEGQNSLTFISLSLKPEMKHSCQASLNIRFLSLRNSIVCLSPVITPQLSVMTYLSRKLKTQFIDNLTDIELSVPYDQHIAGCKYGTLLSLRKVLLETTFLESVVAI